jgi:molybdopterin synthase catalytic subunit
MLDARLVSGPIDAQAEAAGALAAAGKAGALATFTGLARDRSRDGATVERLWLDHHPRLSEASLAEIGRSALARFDLAGLRIVHGCGEIAPGEPIVFVAAGAAHRRAAFEAVDYVMDRLKTDAMLWKREDAGGASAWIEPSEHDRSDRARWGE